jgi:hypothetical protein
MSGKAVAEKRFDEILRRMLQSRPLSRAAISKRIQARRRAGRIKNIRAPARVQLERDQRLVG